MKGTVAANMHLIGHIGGVGFSGGTKDYNKLSNKPSLNGVELVGDLRVSDLIDPEEGLGLKIDGVPLTADTTLLDLGSVPVTNDDIDEIVDEVFKDGV